MLWHASFIWHKDLELFFGLRFPWYFDLNIYTVNTTRFVFPADEMAEDRMEMEMADVSRFRVTVPRLMWYFIPTLHLVTCY